MPVRIRHILRLVCLISLLLALPSPAHAQDPLRLNIDQVDFSRFPRVDVVVSVRDSLGLPVQGLFAEHFSLREAGTAISEFSVTPIYEQPLDLVLVMDTSATTGFGSKPTPLEAAGRAARNIVNSLGEQDRAAVVAFGNDVAIVQPLTLNKHPVNASLSLLQPAGNSALNDAMLTALNLLKESQRSMILLLTDGPDSGRSQLSTNLVAQAAFQQGVPVFIIGWRAANSRDIQNLAALTGGSLQFLEGNAPAPEDLQAAVNSLQPAVKGLRGQYHLTYNSGLQADDQEHTLVVQVVNQGHRREADASITAIARQVAISLPGLQDGQTVGGIVTIAPQVSAPAPLTRLELLVDGKPIALLDPLAPETAYDTALLSPGEHILTTRAQDTTGNTGQLELTLEVRPPVTVTLLSPPAGAILRGETILAAKVVAIPEVKNVEFWVDDQLIAEQKSPPYETVWDASELAAGPHQVRTVVFDVQGHSAEATHSVTVPSPNYVLPLVLIMVVLSGVAAVIYVPLRLRRRQQQRDRELSNLFTRKPASLREMEGLNPGRIWVLDKDEFHLGRKRDENDLPLKGLSAARHQAVIRYQEGDYVIFSLFPEKPALVNEIPAHPQAVLKSGDTLRLGETVLHFEMQA